MLFTLAGVEQIENIRRYRFDAVNDDQSKQQFVVGVDLILIRKHRIPIQELPLLCQGVLEHGTKVTSMMFTEGDMVKYVDARAAADAAAESLKKRLPRRKPGQKHGPEWSWPSDRK
jgi:hypothetical protein